MDDNFKNIDQDKDKYESNLIRQFKQKRKINYLRQIVLNNYFIMCT